MDKRGQRKRCQDKEISKAGFAEENASIAPEAKKIYQTIKRTRGAQKKVNEAIILKSKDTNSSGASDNENDQASSKATAGFYATIMSSSSTESADERALLAENNADNSNTNKQRKQMEDWPQNTSHKNDQKSNNLDEPPDLLIPKTELYVGSYVETANNESLELDEANQCSSQRSLNVSVVSNFERKLENNQEEDECNSVEIGNNIIIKSSRNKKVRKFQRTTRKQLDFYLEFAKKHPEIDPGKYNANDERLKDLWQELTDNLNALEGARRTAEKWNESMNKCLHQLHYRQREMKAACRLNGMAGGVKMKRLSYIEKELLNSKNLQPKYQRTSRKQLNFYLEFVKRHPEIEPGKYNANTKMLKDLWKQLAENLNSLPGATRTAQKWSMSMNNYLHQLRHRQRKLSTGFKTYGGNKHLTSLIPLEKHILGEIAALNTASRSNFRTRQSKKSSNSQLTSPASSHSPSATLASATPPLTLSASSENSANNSNEVDINAPDEEMSHSKLPSRLLGFESVDNPLTHDKLKTYHRPKLKLESEPEPVHTPPLSLCFQNANSNPLKNNWQTDGHTKQNVQSSPPENRCPAESYQIDESIKNPTIEEMFNIIQSSLQKTEKFQEELLEEQRKMNKSLQRLAETHTSVLQQLCITNKLLLDNINLNRK